MALTRKQLNAIDSSPALKELKPWILAIDNDDEPAVIKKYWFISYGDSSGSEELGRGTVKTTGATQNGYTQVVVTSNDSISEDFVGNKYWVTSNAKDDGSELYQLYSGAGTSATGMYVKISTAPFPEEEEAADDDT